MVIPSIGKVLWLKMRYVLWWKLTKIKVLNINSKRSTSFVKMILLGK